VSGGEISIILERIRRGEKQAADRLLPLVYDELRRLAATRLASEQAGHTLEPTALVHEAWLRLGGDEQPDWRSRAHFFAAAAGAMRRILIDRARRRLAQRGRGYEPHVSIDNLDVAVAAQDERTLDLNEALKMFAKEEPKKAEVVMLHFFGGLTFAEIAQVLEIAEPTARRWWTYARAWLLEKIAAMRT
jgi:RNA polymerase sigma factor (TIGR02999 family)